MGQTIIAGCLINNRPRKLLHRKKIKQKKFEVGNVEIIYAINKYVENAEGKQAMFFF